jgi:hypothetical protein
VSSAFHSVFMHRILVFYWSLLDAFKFITLFADFLDNQNYCTHITVLYNDKCSTTVQSSLLQKIYLLSIPPQGLWPVEVASTNNHPPASEHSPHSFHCSHLSTDKQIYMFHLSNLQSKNKLISFFDKSSKFFVLSYWYIAALLYSYRL